MPQSRDEKRTVAAELTLASGKRVKGCFFLAGPSVPKVGPERVAELLNSETGLFPFTTHGSDAETSLFHRAHVVLVRLLDATREARLEAGYAVATERFVTIILSTGVSVVGAVRVYRPEGRDSLSDWAHSADVFRYVEAADGTTFIVNSTHIVEAWENVSETSAVAVSRD